MYAVEAVELGAIRADMGLLNYALANKAGKDLYKTAILLGDSCRYHYPD
jgi:hypothetical protein